MPKVMCLNSISLKNTMQLAVSWDLSPAQCAAITWLKSSVQIQMAHLFVFVWIEPFLVAVTQVDERHKAKSSSFAFAAAPLGCAAVLTLQRSFVSPARWWTGWRPLSGPSMHVSRVLERWGLDVHSVMLNLRALHRHRALFQFLCGAFWPQKTK